MNRTPFSIKAPILKWFVNPEGKIQPVFELEEMLEMQKELTCVHANQTDAAHLLDEEDHLTYIRAILPIDRDAGTVSWYLPR